MSSVNKRVKNNNNKTPKSQGKPTQNLSTKIDKVLKMIPRGTFAGIGNALGGPAGALIGAGISTISGYGSYKIDNNTLLRETILGPEAENIPSFSENDHGTRIRHREMITSLTATGTAYFNEKYDIDVTNAALFPWLSTLAANYQKYKIHGLVFYYKSTSTDYNNSGVIAMAVQYNPSELAFVSMKNLLNSQFAVSSKPSLSFAAPMECDPNIHSGGGYYISHANNADYNPKDERFSVAGNLNVATEGLSVTAGTVLGQLWCTYDIELIGPYTVSDSIQGENNVKLGHFAVPANTSVSNKFDTSDQYVKQFNLVSDSSADTVPTTISWAGAPELIGKKFRVTYSATPTVANTNIFSVVAQSGTSSGATITNYEDFSGTTYAFRTRDFTVTNSLGAIIMNSFNSAAADRHEYWTIYEMFN